MGNYDFFYLPIDFKNKCNVGYAFINFSDPSHVAPFIQEFDGHRWKNFNSEKVCAITLARIQGKQAMILRFQNSSLLEKDQGYKPLLFTSSGPNKGNAEPFPSAIGAAVLALGSVPGSTGGGKFRGRSGSRTDQIDAIPEEL